MRLFRNEKSEQERACGLPPSLSPLAIGSFPLLIVENYSALSSPILLI
jgi:hypothetical protein